MSIDGDKYLASRVADKGKMLTRLTCKACQKSTVSNVQIQSFELTLHVRRAVLMHPAKLA